MAVITGEAVVGCGVVNGVEGESVGESGGVQIVVSSVVVGTPVVVTGV